MQNTLRRSFGILIIILLSLAFGAALAEGPRLTASCNYMTAAPGETLEITWSLEGEGKAAYTISVFTEDPETQNLDCRVLAEDTLQGLSGSFSHTVQENPGDTLDIEVYLLDENGDRDYSAASRSINIPVTEEPGLSSITATIGFVGSPAEFEQGDPVEVAYRISGGNGVYSDISLYVYYRNPGETSSGRWRLGSFNPEESEGTLTCDPARGCAVSIWLSFHDADGGYHIFESEETPVHVIYVGQGWVQQDGKWYYGDEYGCAVTGYQLISDEGTSGNYCFDKNGVMQTGFIRNEELDVWEYYGDDGKENDFGVGMTSITIPGYVDKLKPYAFAAGDHIVIHCEPDSYAEAFARRYGLQYDTGIKQVVSTGIRTVREKVKWIVENYTDDSMTDFEKVAAMCDWLGTNAVYDYTYSNYGPDGVLLKGCGVCQSYAEAYSLLMEEAGIPVLLISGSAQNIDSPAYVGHAWNMVFVEGNWYHVDTTWGDITGAHSFFMIGDEHMSRDHRWYSSVKAPYDYEYGPYHDNDLDGWVQAYDSWIYYKYGTMATEPTVIDGVEYGFGWNGALIVNGWGNDSGALFHTDSSGAVERNKWIYAGGNWYYLNDRGRAALGWQVIDGTMYHFNSYGVLSVGWMMNDTGWYYFNENGIRAAGWQEIGGDWYYFAEDGKMADGWLQYGNGWYYLGDDGIMKTGWQEIAGTWYYFGASGLMTTGWLNDGGAWYYFQGDGSLASGWQEIGGAWYYFTADSSMATGWQEIGGRWELFADSGEWLYTYAGD